MTWSEVVVLVGTVVAIAVVISWRTATRLDRLHRKVVASRIALDAQLIRRSSAAVGLVVSGALDPASTMVLMDATLATGAADEDAQGGRELTLAVPDLAIQVHGVASGQMIGQALADGFDEERVLSESNLSATLRSALDDADTIEDIRACPDGADLLTTLGATWYRVQLARRFHNAAVAQTQRMRAKRGVRLFRLAGHAPMPHMVEFDDAWPASLGHPGDTVRRA